MPRGAGVPPAEDELLFQGDPIGEIAGVSDRSERRVRKVLDQVKERLSRRCGPTSWT
jgi:hypothetical protein